MAEKLGLAEETIRVLRERVRELEDRTCSSCKHLDRDSSCTKGIVGRGRHCEPSNFFCKLHEPKEATECPGNTTDGT